MKFWTLCRCGFRPLDGRPSWRVFRAAVAVCGLPRPFVRPEGRPGHGHWLSVGLEFYGPTRGAATGKKLFRCYFEVRLFPVRSERSWFGLEA